MTSVGASEDARTLRTPLGGHSTAAIGWEPEIRPSASRRSGRTPRPCSYIQVVLCCQRHDGTIADERQAAPAPDAVQRAIEHGQPPVPAELLGDHRLGVAHQAPKLLPGHLDVAALDGVRLPLPTVTVSGQADGSPRR